MLGLGVNSWLLQECGQKKKKVEYFVLFIFYFFGSVKHFVPLF